MDKTQEMKCLLELICDYVLHFDDNRKIRQVRAQILDILDDERYRRVLNPLVVKTIEDFKPLYQVPRQLAAAVHL